jgi:hypothetical protein
MRLLWSILALLFIHLSVPADVGAQTRLEKARPYFLHDLFMPRDFRPGKNSFILQHVRRGDRKILLELDGSGSIRHIWSTWCRSFDLNTGTEPGKVLLRVFVNGESVPGLHGNLEELFTAAERTGDRYMPQPAFNYEGGYNLYLPIFFQRGIRVEMEALDDLDEFYVQLDYRKTASPESSALLRCLRDSSGLSLEYQGEGAPDFRRSPNSPYGSLFETRFEFDLSPDSNGADGELKGPGIIRQYPATVSWQPAAMIAGFLDLCHFYRHFITRVSGTGFIAGAGRYRATTEVYAPRALTATWLIGHDDRLSVRINDRPVRVLAESLGFQAEAIEVQLDAGWNRVVVTFENQENVNWRWPGFSLAVKAGGPDLAGMRWGR